MSMESSVSELFGILRTVFISDAAISASISKEYEGLLIESLKDIDENSKEKLFVILRSIIAIIHSINFDKLLKELPQDIDKLSLRISTYTLALTSIEEQFKKGEINGTMRAAMRNTITKMKRLLNCVDKILETPSKYVSCLAVLNKVDNDLL